jgi:hypothetical protein
MTRDYRELSISGRAEFTKLDWFVEDICDFYNINNEYFGNVLLATTEAADILFSITGLSPESVVKVFFTRNCQGLEFKLKLKMDHLDTSSIEKEDDLDREIRKHNLEREIFIIRALVDEIHIAPNAKSMTLMFYVSSMNYEKSLKRISELKEYWNKRNLLTLGK